MAVYYDQQSKPDAEAEQDEPILVIQMHGVRNDARILIKEGRSGLFESYAVSSSVFRRLALVPLERQIAHSDIVTTL